MCCLTNSRLAHLFLAVYCIIISESHPRPIQALQRLLVRLEEGRVGDLREKST